MTNQLRDIKAMIAEFQNETKSNSVLDLTMWIENRLALSEKKKEELKEWKSTFKDYDEKINFFKDMHKNCDCKNNPCRKVHSSTKTCEMFE